MPTTTPLNVQIYQATEPQTLRADIRLALASIGGESGHCIMVGSTVATNHRPRRCRRSVIRLLLVRLHEAAERQRVTDRSVGDVAVVP